MTTCHPRFPQEAPSPILPIRAPQAHIAEVARWAGARLVATGNRRHFTPLLRHGIRVLVSAELIDEIGR